MSVKFLRRIAIEDHHKDGALRRIPGVPETCLQGVPVFRNVSNA